MNWLTALELGAVPAQSNIVIKGGEGRQPARIAPARALCPPAFQPSDEYVIFMQDLQGSRSARSG